MAEIVLERVTKAFGDAVVVDGVDVVVKKGELVAFLGPSGCGKSTTLRLIAGLDPVTRGRILIGGQDVTSAPPAARGVSMVFQSYALFPHLTVAENIVFGLRVRKVAADELKARLDDAAKLLGLSALLDRKPSQLSGGQQQRVALGRAIVARSPVCLMDEPLSNLDAQLRSDMRREIRELQQSLGVTMIYVTHDQVEAMTMADQVVLMHAGRVEQQGAPADLYQAPQTIFAAKFIGTPPMNVLKLDQLSHAGVRLPGAENFGVAIADLAIGVRPEAVMIGTDGFDGRVGTIEYLGADTLVDVVVGAQRIVVRVPGRATLNAGDAVKVTWQPEAAHWFQLSSGRRISRT